jgi:hypothetical protein
MTGVPASRPPTAASTCCTLARDLSVGSPNARCPQDRAFGFQGAIELVFSADACTGTSTCETNFDICAMKSCAVCISSESCNLLSHESMPFFDQPDVKNGRNSVVLLEHLHRGAPNTSRRYTCWLRFRNTRSSSQNIGMVVPHRYFLK